MKYSIALAAPTLAATALALAAGVGAAQAGCAYQTKMEHGSVHLMPGFIVAHMSPPASSARPNGGNAAQNIVGTWMATYTVEGQPFGQALIQWHSDYTEWENINLPLSGGNLCVGAWKSVDPLHVTRLHYGWLYTDGTLTGYFIETETDKIVHPNSYSGVNDQKIFDLNGNLQVEVSGTSSAVRIAP